MTKQEAENLKSFDHYCNCGGFAWSMNGRDQKDPHRSWCAQKPQYDQWWAALHAKPDKTEQQD